MKINVHAPIGYTGYGVAGLNIVKSLVSRGNEVALWHKPNPSVDNQVDADIVSEAIRRQDFCSFDAPSLKIWHQFDLIEHIGRGKYYAFPFFELDTFNEKEIKNIQFPDHIFVTCQWAKDVVCQYRDTSEVSIVPLGVDENIFAPKVRKRNDRFVIANFGKWEKRKGHDVLADIFNKAFLPTDDVELRMYPYNPFLNEKEVKTWEDHYMFRPLGHRTFISSRIQTHVELARHMSLIDVAIFPSRAEGWNLELLETMAMGKTVITTNYSAHTGFCNKDNAILVDIDAKEKAHDGKWFFGAGSWAKLGDDQIDAFVEALRVCYKKWQHDDASLYNECGIATGKGLTWDNTASIIEERFNE